MKRVELEKTARALEALAECEREREREERALEVERQRRLGPVYARRSKAIEGIAGFWGIVLTQHGEFANYVRAADWRYVEAIRRVEVEWAGAGAWDFAITVEFGEVEGRLRAQSVRKQFTVGEDGEVRSAAVEMEWPKRYDGTFFAWFRWTGERPGEEFANGDELARLFSEELFPYCVRYYAEAQRDVEEEEEEEEEEEDMY
ncbi:AFR641Wp [Eremothecium gossypii ATCC 10895]|uniref:AFR641Wp n=1 Tax=Eremothecium gossypii (strain ATCC 10895 / CBS 109.51 / FGSC 9923 / NRRL Y-1056) TaxID=284811 RepID=Q752D5_EREGS|nr:AFR641Wp [Eremothecium gossypii ATCC 10895]AAS54012.1 AFR641Wp [Eremothecium gossypii ATCC 10895]AEY98326.1 FAFR641Wp [Eremothecium gossypii FDAG1]